MNYSSKRLVGKFIWTVLLLLNLAEIGFSQAGTLDLSFGSGGIVTTNFGNSEDFAGEILVQPDKKNLLIGWSYDGISEDFALARYLPDGHLDETFGNVGKVITDFQGKDNTATKGALQADGKILVVGSFRLGVIGFGDKVMLVRYLPDGNLDPSFGVGGIVSTGIDSVPIFGLAVAVQSDDRIVVAGTYDSFYGNFMVLRYLPNGNLDDSFGINGMVTTTTRLFMPMI